MNNDELKKNIYYIRTSGVLPRLDGETFSQMSDRLMKEMLEDNTREMNAYLNPYLTNLETSFPFRERPAGNDISKHGGSARVVEDLPALPPGQP